MCFYFIVEKCSFVYGVVLVILTRQLYNTELQIECSGSIFLILGQVDYRSERLGALFGLRW